MQEFQVLRALEPTLRMKALQQQSSERFYLQRREEKDCVVGTQKLVIPLGQGGNWVL
jgi:hypothetical protein